MSVLTLLGALTVYLRDSVLKPIAFTGRFSDLNDKAHTHVMTDVTDLAAKFSSERTTSAGAYLDKVNGDTVTGPFKVQYPTPIVDIIDQGTGNNAVRLRFNRAARQDQFVSDSTGFRIDYNYGGVTKAVLFDGTDLKINTATVWHTGNFDRSIGSITGLQTALDSKMTDQQVRDIVIPLIIALG